MLTLSAQIFSVIKLTVDKTFWQTKKRTVRFKMTVFGKLKQYIFLQSTLAQNATIHVLLKLNCFLTVELTSPTDTCS
jgi:hypothetical protein